MSSFSPCCDVLCCAAALRHGDYVPGRVLDGPIETPIPGVGSEAGVFRQVMCIFAVFLLFLSLPFLFFVVQLPLSLSHF